MNSSHPPPKLPLWIFIATDLALIGAATFVALRSEVPLSMRATLAIVGCVALGAIVGLVPIIAYFERVKNETLDERQRALEALARTLTASAEQMSIATGGLHGVADLAQKNLRHAEQLPHKLQEKIAEFQAQLATAEDVEREELERELLALRTSESERLESVSQRIAKSAAEWAKLEHATQQHLAAASDALAKLSLGTASAIGKAQAAAEQALSQARVEAARAIGEASGHAARAIETSEATALERIEARLARVTRALDERLARFESLAQETKRVAQSTPAPTSAVDESSPAETFDTPAGDEAGSSSLPPAAPVKRARRPRREEESQPSVGPAAPSPAPTAPPETPLAPVFAVDEPPPVPVSAIEEIAPVAPATAEPFTGSILGAIPVVVPANAGHEPANGAGAPEVSKQRRRVKHAEVAEPTLGLDLGDSIQDPTGASERMLTSDGATRLLVTAYIGIGNRLFIRGAGPGLSWDRGVPLQFVSIGKWRWETSDASEPVQFKLYKNDDVECALGAQTLDPGHQQEVTAAF